MRVENYNVVTAPSNKLLLNKQLMILLYLIVVYYATQKLVALSIISVL